ncbi:MAG: CcdB family protein [Rhizobiaceae bacterium]
MAQYDLYAIASGYVVDVQSDLMDQLNTRIVVPLIPITKASKPMQRLNPAFPIQDEEHVLQPQLLAAVLLSELQLPVSNIAVHHDEIRSALDMVFIGF